MIGRIIVGILNIIMILPVYATLIVNPVNLPISNLENDIYSLEFDRLTTEHSIKYCLDITIDQNFYYEIILDNGITWGSNINPVAIENAVLINNGKQDSSTATFFVRANSKPIVSGTCLNLDTELVINVPLAPLGTEFTITTTIKDPISGVNLSVPETKSLVKLTKSCSNITEIPQIECETLVELYNNTYGNNWTDSYNWNLTNTPCSWEGVSCINQHVITIERQTKNLTGSLPDLSALTELQTLDLKNNKLLDRIPKLDALVNLQSIDLANNQLTGNIPNLENLINLRHLNLANNKLEGAIPTNLQGLKNLELLKLNNNKIAANIPDLSNLTKLQTIWLQNNQLEANIPNINNLIDLTDLDLGYNKLIADATLQEFIISKDSDWANTQTVPPTDIIATVKSPTSIEITWTPIFYTADTGYYQISYSTTTDNSDVVINTNSKADTSIIINDLSPNTTYYFTVATITKAHDQQQNELRSVSGEFAAVTLSNIIIPENTVPKITVIDVDVIDDGNNINFDNVILNSEFTRTFTVINNSDTSVNLSQLEIIGDEVFRVKEYFELFIVTIAEGESTTFSISLDTSKPGIFTAEILFHFSHQNNPYNFFITTTVITNEVAATDCSVQTNIPEIECQTLLTLYEKTAGNNWNENTNWNKTNNPCDWIGISCAITGNYIAAIELTNNNLVGTIPDLSSLINLQKLDLSFNQLTGDIPISLSNLINLTSLNLDYNKLTSQNNPNLSALLSSLNPNWNTTQTIPPNDIKITDISPTTVSLQWTAITYQFATGSYSVKYETTSGSPYGNVKEFMVVNNDPKNIYAEQIDNLLPNTDYYFVVETNTNSNNYISNSEPSSEFLTTTLPNVFSSPEPNSLLDMGSSELGTPSTAINITILQPEIEITDISIADTNDFVVSNERNILTMQCIPSEIGTRESVLKISYLVAEAVKTAQYFLTCIGKPTLNYDSDPKPNSVIEIATTRTLTIFAYEGLEIIDYLLVGEHANDFSVSELKEDSNYELIISCSPIDIGEHTAKLNINTNNPVQNIISYELKCIGKSTLNYDSDPKPNSVIEIATTRTLTIFAYEGLEIIDYLLVGEHVNDFSVSELIEDSNYELIISCNPIDIGEHTAKLNINTNNLVQNIISYELKCINNSPIYTSKPEPDSTLSMSAIIATSTATSIEISNTGNEILTITEVIITNNEVFQINNTPFSINDEVHKLEVQCIPIQAKKYLATITLITNLAKSINYQLECIGIEDKIKPIYSSIPEPNTTLQIGSTVLDTAISKFIIISNQGDESLTIETNIITGDPNFSIIKGAAPTAITDATHNLEVQCIPTAIGKYTAQLTLQTNDPIKNLVKYNLTCTGITGFSVTGEIRVQAGISGDNISIESSEIFSLIGWIKPDPQHIGQLADIIVNYYWKAFDGNSSLTIPIKVSSQVELSKELKINLFEGSITNMAGIFEVEFGYQTNDNKNFIGKIAQLEIKPNSPPTEIELNIGVDNNLIGAFNTIDNDNADRFIYSLINQTKYFKIINNALYVTNLMPKFNDIRLVDDDSASANIYPIEVQTTDISGDYYIKKFIIQSIPIINPPIIHLTKKSVVENYQGIVGKIWSDSMMDNFELVENENFDLDNEGILRTKRPLDFETNSSHNITIQGTTEKTFTIDIINIPDITIHGELFENITNFIETTTNNLEAVKIQFIPDITHRDLEADILAVASYTIDQQTNFLVRNDETWQEWDRFTLPAFTHLILEDEHEIALFNSNQFPAGELQVYIGYRLDNKELIYNSTPITIEIN